MKTKNMESLFIVALILCLFATSDGQEARENGNTDNQLIATHVVIPRYFAAALATRSQGEVTVEVQISPDGNIIDAKTISGNEILGGNSIYVLRMWKFNPSLNGTIRKTQIIFPTGWCLNAKFRLKICRFSSYLSALK